MSKKWKRVRKGTLSFALSVLMVMINVIPAMAQEKANDISTDVYSFGIENASSKMITYNGWYSL